MTRVWIAQCLCPARHCIMAGVGEAETRREAEDDIAKPLRETVAEALNKGIANPRCGICKAPADTWIYDLSRTPFRSMKEAEPHLRINEAEQALAREMFGDMKRSD